MNSIWKRSLAMFLSIVMVFGMLPVNAFATGVECEHSYASEVTKEATCEDVGETTYTCGLCGDVYTEEIPATDHAWGEGVETAATCTEDGYTTYTCGNCGTTKTEGIAATGHDMVDGACTVCGEPEETEDDSTEESSEAPAECNCKVKCNEQVNSACPVCGAGDITACEGEAAHEHSYQAVVTAPTCGEDGYTTYTCADETCKHTYTDDVVPATEDHDYVEGVCTVCGGAEPASQGDGDPDAPVIVMGGVTYDTLQAALDACNTHGDYTILLSGTIDENVAWEHVAHSGKNYQNITIDGQDQTTFTGKMTISSSSTNKVNYLTIQNIDFTSEEKDHVFITSSGLNRSEVLIQNCNFTGNGTGKAIYNKKGLVTIKDCEATKLEYFLHNYDGSTTYTLENVIVTETTNAAYIHNAGSSTFTNCEFDVENYGIQHRGDGSKQLTLDSCKISAKVPVEISPTNSTYDYKVVVNGTNEMQGNNEEGCWLFVLVNKNYGTGAAGLTNIILNDTDLPVSGIYWAGPVGTFNGGMVNVEDEDNTFITADIANLKAIQSVALELYDANDILLATTTLLNPDYFVSDSLSVKFCINGTSGSWSTEWVEGKLRADYVPASATLFVDGKNMGSADIRMIKTGTEESINWADVTGVPAVPVNYVAQVGEVKYTDLQEAIVAAAPNGTVELLSDVTVDKWIMFSEKLSIGSGQIITIDIDGLAIDGNDHTLTIKDIESAGNGNRLFYDATKLNIKDLTINYVDAAANLGGIGLTSGVISNVTFIGGCGVFPGTGDIEVTGCTFKTNGAAFYNEHETDKLVVTGNTFELGKDTNVILLRGDVTFTGNTIVSGRTVNVVSGSPVVTGNDFNDVRLKVYEAATATISENEINNLVFENETVPTQSTFTGNTLSEGAQDALDKVTASSTTVEVADLDALIAALADETNDKEIVVTKTIVIPADQTVVLDLNGKTVSMVYSENATANHEMIHNYGNLTIQDSGENGKLSYQYTGANLGTTYAANTITTEPGSVLTVKSGTIENLTFDSGTIAYAIDGRTNGGAGDVTVNIEGGTITSLRQSIRIFANSTTNTGALNISGGEITGRVIVQNANANANKAALEITGGTFNANSYKTDVLYVGGSNGATIDMEPVVSNGTFNGGITSTMTSGFITGGTFTTDVTDCVADGYEVTGNADGTYGVAEKPIAYVAKIGDQEYTSLDTAFAEAAAGDTITLLADATPTLISQRAITNASIIDLGGKTLTLTEDDLYFGTTTFKNGTIVVAPTVKASTAVFWMFANQTLIFDNVEIVATGVIGTYLIGINGGTGSAVKLINGSKITINNNALTGLSTVICDNGNGNSVVIKNSTIDVDKIDGRFYLGGTNGTITVENSTIDLDGVKEGFYLRAGQNLSIEGTSDVDIVLNSTDGRYGINMEAASATYTKADTATVNGTVYKAPVKVTDKASLDAAIAAAQPGDTITLTADIDYGTDHLKIEKAITLDLGGHTLTTRARNYGIAMYKGCTVTNGKLNHAGTVAAIKVWDAKEISDLEIDVTGTSTSGSGIDGIVIQENAAGVDTIKNVTIHSSAGQGITAGIKTHNCGNATEPVIGSMENVEVDVKGTALNIYAPCGTATGCTFKGGENGIEIWIKGTYSASLTLENCAVTGGVYAHDEFNSNPSITNNGTLTLTVDEATTGVEVEDITLTIARIGDSQIKSDELIYVKQHAVAKIGDTYYMDLDKAVADAATGATITLLPGEHKLDTSFTNKELTFMGLEGEKANTVMWDAYNNYYQFHNTKFHFVNLTIDGKVTYGGNEGLHHSVGATYENCNIKGMRYLFCPTTFTGCAFDSTGEEHSFWTYGASTVTVTDCDFTYADRAVNCYSENGPEFEQDITFTDCTFTYTGNADAPEGAVEINSSSVKSIDLTMNGCTGPAKGDMWFISQWDGKDGANTTVFEDDEQVWPVPVAKIGETTYTALQDAIDAATAAAGTYEITLLPGTIDEDVVIHQTEGVNITIKGNEKDTIFTGYIEVYGHARIQGAETLTFDGVLFQTSEASHTFIEQTCQTSTTESAAKCYPHNITVQNCSFTATGDAVNTAVGMKYRYGYNITVKDTTSEAMHSLMQNYAGVGLTVEDVTITGKNGIALGTSQNVTVKNATIDAIGYGLRYDAELATTNTIDGCTIEAFIPVVVRKTTADGYALNVIGENTMTATNTDGYWMVIGKEEYEKNGELPNLAKDVALNITGNVTSEQGIYGIRDYVAEVGGVKYEDFVTALKAVTAENNEVNILKDITITENWDNRYTGAKFTVPVVINGNDKTIKFEGQVSDGGNYHAAFRFEADAEVNDLTIDMSTATANGTRFRAISAKGNLTVDGCKFIGNPAVTNSRAIIFGEGERDKISELEARIIACEFTDWTKGLTDNENGGQVKLVGVNGSKFNNAKVTISAAETIHFNNNEVFDCAVDIRSYLTDTSALVVKAAGNTLDDEYVNAIINADKIETEDAFIYGTITLGYVSEPYYNGVPAVWGEATSNAKESFIIEVYAGSNKIATTTLTDLAAAGTPTWHAAFENDGDTYWSTEWTEGNPSAANKPTSVRLLIDGVKVSEKSVMMSKPDGLEPVVWEELEYFKPDVAQTKKADGTAVDTYKNFEEAIAAAAADSTITEIVVLCDSALESVENTEEYYDITGQLVITADQKVTVTGCGFAVRVMGNGASLTIAENVTIEGLDVVANGFATTGENMTIDGTLKALSLKQWTNNGTITVNKTGSVWLGYGDGQFDMAYGNGTVTITGNGDKTAAQFKAGYSGTRGNGNTLNLKDTYFEGGAWFNVNGSNGTINADNALLKVSGGDGAGSMTIASSGNVINLTNGSELIVANLAIGEGNTVKLGTGSKITTSKITGAGTIVIDATGYTAGQASPIEGDASGFTGTIEVTNNEAFEAKIVDGSIVLVEKTKIASIGDKVYYTLQAAVDAAKEKDEIVILADTAESVTLPAGVTLNGNGKTINGTVTAGGDLTIKGETVVAGFSAGWYNNTITIGEGASLKVTSGRMTVSYGNTFNITGSVNDAKTADKTTLTPSLELVAGISFNGDGGDVKFNVTNAYVKLGDSTTKPGGATGKFNMNFTSSIVDFTKTLKTYMPTGSGLVPEFNFTATDSVVDFASHLELWLDNTTMTLDKTNLTVGGSFANAGTVNVTNGANFVVKAPIMSTHGGNTGTINVTGGTFELADSNQDWENAGSITVSGNGKVITNDFKNVGAGELVLKSATATITGKADLGVTTDIEKATVKYDEATKTYSVELPDVAQVGDTKYKSIDEAIAAWTNNTTLTLLADVTLSDVIKLSSTEYHTLNLGTYTMTAAAGKHAIEITCNGQGTATYGLIVKADAENPGGITATGKSCIYYRKSGTTKDRVIIRVDGGVFNGSYAINVYSSNRGTNCPQVSINGGTFNGNVNIGHGKLIASGGTFNGWVNCTGDSTAYRQISGGRYKNWQFMTADASNKFWVGTSQANYNVGVYVDDEGYLVVGGPVITEAGETFEAVVNDNWANISQYQSHLHYLKYSSAAANGLYYTSTENALAANNRASSKITVYTESLDLSSINYKGTILIEDKLTVTFAEGTTPAWTVAAAEGGKEVSYTESVENGIVTRTYGVFVPVAQIGETKYPSVKAALTAADNGDTVTLIWAEGDDAIDMKGTVSGKTVTITGTADVDWSKGWLYVGRNGAADGTLIFDKANLTSVSNSREYGINVSGAKKDSSDTFNGTVILKDSTIVLDYMIQKNVLTLDNSTLTVNNGCGLAGRDASDSASGVDATATTTLSNGSKLILGNCNGMGLGYEGIGILDVDATSTFETTQAYQINAKGTLNLAGTAKINGTLTNNGKVVLTDVNATLTSNECGNVETNVADYKVVYADGAYKLVKKVYVAEINGKGYETLAEAAKDIATDGSDTTIKILTDIELDKSIVFNYGTGKVIFTADEPVTVKQVAIGLDLDFTMSEAANIVVDENVTFEIYDNAGGMYLYYGPSLTVNGTITGGQNWGVLYLYDGTHNVTETGKIGTGRVQLAHTEMTAKGEIDTNYLLVEGSTFTADGATVDANVIYDNNNGGQRWGASEFVIKEGAEVTTSKLTLSYADSTLTIDLGSKLTATEIGGAGKIIIDATGYAEGTACPIVGNASGFTGTIEVINSDDLMAGIDENGNIYLYKAVAKIGETKYASLDAALDAAKAAGMTEVEIQILADCEFDPVKTVGFTKLTLTGTDRAQKVTYKNSTTYATTCDVTFNGLTVKNTTNWLNSYYYTAKTTYNDCKLIGNYRVTTPTVFTGCEFTYEDDCKTLYNVFIYGGEVVTIENCTFNSYERAIKIFNEIFVTTNLTITNTTFNSATEKKSVIEIDQANATGINISIDNKTTATGFRAGYISTDDGNTFTEAKLAHSWFAIEKDDTEKCKYNIVVDGELLYCGVAKIADKHYATLAEAVAAAQDNDTITMLANVTLDDVVNIERAITLDLNTKTITGADGAIVLNVKADTTIKNGSIKGNKSGTSSGLIDIYADLTMEGVTVETSKINALRFKAGDCTAILTDCDVTGAFKGYGGSIWNIESGTYKASSTSINDQLNGTASVSGGTFHYEIAEEECAPGYAVVNNGNGTWTVKYAPVCFVDTNNNGVQDEGEILYGSLAAVFNLYQEGNVYIVLTDNAQVANKVDTDADAHYYLNTNVETGATVDFLYEGTDTEEAWNYVQKMTVGKNVTLNVPYLLAWTEFNLYGTVNTKYFYTTVCNTTIHESAVLNANTGDATVQVKNGANMTVNGELNTSILNVWVGESKLTVSGENAKVNAKWIDIWDGTPSVVVENGATLTTETIKASRGGSITVDGATLTGAVELGHNTESAGTMTVVNEGTVIGEIKLTAQGSTVTGPKDTLTVVSGVDGYVVIYKDGVHMLAEKDVAEYNGTKYETVSAALNAAMANGGTVTVLRDCEEQNYIIVPTGVTLDLNGYELTAKSIVISTFEGAHIIDSSADNTGVLKAAKGNVRLYETNAQLPAWNGEGYQFFEIGIITNLAVDSDADMATLKFYIHKTGDWKKLLTMFSDTGAEDHNLSVKVRLTYVAETANGPVNVDQDYTYTAPVVIKMAGQLNGGWGVYDCILNGINNRSAITYSAVIQSGTGAEYVKAAN